MIESQNKHEYGIDLFKYLAALSVVGMHMEFLKDINYCLFNIADYFFRFAVPFFFMVSGYLFASHCFISNRFKRKYIKSYIIKIIIPFVMWGGYML